MQAQPRSLPYVHILWDSSHLWGLMAWRALHALGLTCRITKAHEIAAGILQDPDNACLLLVPGGNARLKAQALASEGRRELRAAIARGTPYLGFCGGAGVALSPCTRAKKEENCLLELCPWSRNPYPDRLQHLISGHVRAELSEHELCPPTLRGRTIALPVWWPGRFLARQSADVTVLAQAKHPDRDFWLGDLPLCEIPNHILAAWKTEYGLDLTAQFVAHMPLVVTGTFGLGRYVLSYSHLETPESPEANAWLSAMLSHLTHRAIPQTRVPAWRVRETPLAWPKTATTAPLYAAHAATRDLVDLATRHHLFVPRTSWLLGWKSRLPGALVNTLMAALHAVLSVPPTAQALRYWEQHNTAFTETFSLFAKSAEESLLTSRIASVLGDILPHTVRRKDREERQKAIFGCPRNGGGLVGSLLDDLEEILYLAQESLV